MTQPDQDTAPKQPFRSWAEDYPHDSRAMPPVDREAFRIRAIQRSKTQNMLRGASYAQPVTRGQAIRQRSDRSFSARIGAEADRKVRATTEPVEIARLFLQRRGLVVFRASVVDGSTDRWEVAGFDHWLGDAELIALAVRRGLKPNTEGHDHVGR